MAKEFRFYAIKDANDDIKATSAAINALLEQAKVTTIAVNGKPVPATADEVPNALKVAAFAATVKEGAADKELSEVLANNQILADQAKELEKRAATAETTAQTLVSEKSLLEAQLATERATTARLTAEVVELTNTRKAANERAASLTAQNNANNTEISKRCLAVGCLLDLRDENNNILASDAPESEKLAAANRIPVPDKLNALCGAVNTALTRVAGVQQIPNGAPVTPAIPAGKENKPKNDLKGLEKTKAAFAEQALKLLGRKPAAAN